jgi:hypothetical protein
MEDKDQKIEESRDAWTGGYEWNRIFNIRTFLFIVLVIYLFYLFLKYVMPLIKQNFGKK